MQNHDASARDEFATRPNRWPWPPIIYTSAVALCWALQEFAPLALLDGFIASAPRWAGLGLVAAGFLLDALAMIALARRRTAILPNMGASALVSSGIFAYSRNPIYLGNTILLIGLAIALRWGWLLIAAPITVIAVSRLAIVREEKHLAARFGDEWRAYAARVRRWL
jgi:protein-S-isoprenylcysteine O-methyltransferase Ste14